MSIAAAQIDSVVEVPTPENIAFDYQMAGPLRRLPAFVADFIIRAIIFILVIMCIFPFVAMTGSIAVLMTWQAAILLLWFVLEWFYGGLFETFWNGQTPGKRLMGLRVLTTRGQPINGLQAVMRNVLRFADFMPLIPFAAFCGLFGWDPINPPMDPPEVILVALIASVCPVPTFLVALIVPAMNRRWQRLGDLVCGTMVVIEEKNWMHGVVQLRDPRVPQLAADLPHFEASRSLARALAMYAERRHLFSPPRRQEIAMHLGQPLVDRYHLPPIADNDLLLCAVYWRLFVSDSAEKARPAWAQPQPMTEPPDIRLGPVMERRR